MSTLSGEEQSNCWLLHTVVQLSNKLPIIQPLYTVVAGVTGAGGGAGGGAGVVAAGVVGAGVVGAGVGRAEVVGTWTLNRVHEYMSFLNVPVGPGLES